MPRRDFSKVAFAATGDTVVIPDATQPDGSVSLPQGWGFDYERDNGAGGGTPDPLAKNIEREVMNGVLNEITASIGELQQAGAPIYAATAAPYPINAKVRHNDTNWRSTVANNNTVPGAVGASWVSDDITLFTGVFNVVSIRALGVTYTNTLDRPIIAMVELTSTAANQSCTMTIDQGGGAVIFVGSSFPNTGQSIAGTFMIPPGASYIVPNGAYFLNRWAEVR